MDYNNNIENGTLDGYNKYFSTIKFMMTLSGLWKSSKERHLNIKRFIFYCSMLSIGIYGIFNSLLKSFHDIFSVVECLLFLSLFIIALHAYIHMARNSALINKMFNAVESDFNNFEKKNFLQEMKFKVKTDSNTRLLIQIVSLSIVLAHIFRLSSTNVYYPKSLVKKPFIPFTLHFYHSESLFYYYTTYIFQFCMSSTAGLMNTLSIAVCVGFVNILSCEVDILKSAFQNSRDYYTSRIGYTGSLSNSKNEIGLGGVCLENTMKNSSFYDHLKKLVVQHNYLIRSKEDVQVVISPIAFNMFITSEFMLCFSSFQIYQMCMTSIEIDFTKMMDSIAMVNGLICQQFVYFIFGQKLQSKSNNLNPSLYGNGWHEAAKEYKSCISIVLERTKHPFVLWAGSLIPITLSSFVKCLQATFSYFNLLKALSSN